MMNEFCSQRMNFVNKALALALVSVMSCSIAQAYNTKQTARQPSKLTVVSRVRFVQPKLASLGTPPAGRQRGAASRGECSTVNQPLTALVPATQETLSEINQENNSALNKWQSVWGLTSVESPTLWFYVPYRLTAQLPVNFVLQDERGKTIYKTSFTSEMQPGIVSFRLPSGTRLELNKMYQWYLAINCNTQVPIFVKGWVQRVVPNPALMSKLKAATPQERAALYAANGIWYDALTTLAELRNANPGDATLLNNWASLLDSVKLESLAQQPMRGVLQETKRKTS